MTKEELRNKAMAAKKTKNLTWDGIARHLGRSPVWVVSVCCGMNSAPEPEAILLAEILGLDEEAVATFKEFPHKIFHQAVPTDPLIYRLYEIVGVYGEPIKQVIQEEFGDGIMSAIDFGMTIRRLPDPKGDRVEIVMNGKFLAYKAF